MVSTSSSPGSKNTEQNALNVNQTILDKLDATVAPSSPSTSQTSSRSLPCMSSSPNKTGKVPDDEFKGTSENHDGSGMPLLRRYEDIVPRKRKLRPHCEKRKQRLHSPSRCTRDPRSNGSTFHLRYTESSPIPEHLSSRI